MKQNNHIATIVTWVILIAVSYLSMELGIFKYVRYILGTIVYLFVGFILSMFAGDSPKPWLEKHPVLLYAFHISIIFLWLPIVGILIVWMIIQFVLEMFGIKLYKEEK